MEAWSRRELIRAGVVSHVAAVWSPKWLFGQEPELPPTPSTILGPFYPLIKPPDSDSDLTRVTGKRDRAKGQIIEVAGRVLNRRGNPVQSARVELWQANAMGRYSHPSDPNPAPLDPGFQGYGVQVTDREGRFRFTTVKPGPYPFDKTRIRSPHLHFEVTARQDRRVSQMFFAGESLNEQDVVLLAAFRNRDRLISELLPPPADADPNSRLVVWDIVIPNG
ncbi:MAG: protocatechuate 3,4-dioxygenase [Bryobacteraceae bacterium]|nr:protocatechuate 3,4-dioxygenase [Bryobacteraceae bacterium]